MIGVYGMSFSVFDLLLLLGFGLIGLGLRLFGFPTAPLILALILGSLMEESMRRALQISGGDWSIFIDKPISLSLLIIAALSLGMPLLKKRRKQKAMAAK
jgi:putative tricarboxylic transport membrane protein